MSAETFTGICWVVSALGFSVLAIIAAVAFCRSRTMKLASILAFTFAWYLFCLITALIRFHIVSADYTFSPVTLAIRAAAAVTLWGVVMEYVFGSPLVRLRVWMAKHLTGGSDGTE